MPWFPAVIGLPFLATGIVMLAAPMPRQDPLAPLVFLGAGVLLYVAVMGIITNL